MTPGSTAGKKRGVESLRGQLLIAGPSLFDPNFRRTIILVGEHNEDGALGVVLNRPAPVPVREVAPSLASVVGDGERLFVGGPVEPQSAVALAEFDDPARADIVVFDAIGFLTGEVEADAVRWIRRGRVFAGYAGWGPGQLEDEMAEDGWFVEPALPDDVFTETPETLWDSVVRRKGARFAMLATMPFDPSLN